MHCSNFSLFYHLVGGGEWPSALELPKAELFTGEHMVFYQQLERRNLYMSRPACKATVRASRMKKVDGWLSGFRLWRRPVYFPGAWLLRKRHRRVRGFISSLTL